MTAESTTAHESLVTSGMSNGDIIGIFHADLDRNPAAAPDASGFAYPFVFQLWLTIYIFGIAASRLLNSAHPRELEEALERPWAQQALETFPAGTVRRGGSRQDRSRIRAGPRAGTDRRRQKCVLRGRQQHGP